MIHERKKEFVSKLSKGIENHFPTLFLSFQNLCRSEQLLDASFARNHHLKILASSLEI